jgi:hypothetical protein
MKIFCRSLLRQTGAAWHRTIIAKFMQNDKVDFSGLCAIPYSIRGAVQGAQGGQDGFAGYCRRQAQGKMVNGESSIVNGWLIRGRTGLKPPRYQKPSPVNRASCFSTVH